MPAPRVRGHQVIMPAPTPATLEEAGGGEHSEALAAGLSLAGLGSPTLEPSGQRVLTRLSVWAPRCSTQEPAQGRLHPRQPLRLGDPRPPAPRASRRK